MGNRENVALSLESDGKYFEIILEGFDAMSYPESSDAARDGSRSFTSIKLKKEEMDRKCAEQGIAPGNHILLCLVQVLKSLTRNDNVSVSTESSESGPDTSKYTLSISVRPDGEEFYEIAAEYDACMVREGDLKTLLACLSNMAVSGTLVSEEDERALIELGSGETIEYDQSKTFIDLFLEQVRIRPEALAVSDDEKELTYSELDRLSDAVAGYLLSAGVKEGNLVPLVMDRSVKYPVAFIGVMKAGAAYVPIDPLYPEERKKYMIEDCDAKAVLDDVLVERIICSTDNVHTVNLSLPEGNAYMIYTSGTTGKPKGVLLHHAGLVNHIHSVIKIDGLMPSDRVSEYQAFTFDGHVEYFFPTLAAGASVHIMPESIRKDVPAIYDFIVRHKVTGCGFPTRMAELMLENYDLPVRYVITGGEKLLYKGKYRTVIINTYGPTECTDDSSFFIIEPGKTYDNIPIGYPMPNMHAFVLDTENNLVPVGVRGELCISGPQVGYGYWKQPELTAEKFVDCSYLPGQKMYRTGDLCRWNEDGQLEYIGRIDNQVKLRGFRIELGEIESAATKINGISQAVAMVKNDSLCLYYTGEPRIDFKDAPLDSSSAEAGIIRSELSKTLAEYMVPSAYMHLDKMPLNTNGKIDRKRLPEPEMKGSSCEAPADILEQRIFDIVSELLECKNVGVTDNLISYGLSSIKAMRLSAALSASDINVSVAGILSHPVIREMAEAARESSEGTKQSYYKAHESCAYYPLTENQRLLYLSWLRNKDTVQYNNPSAWYIPVEDVDIMYASLIAVVDAHPYLKTHLVLEGGRDIMQQRRDECAANVTVIDTDSELTGEYVQSRILPFNLEDDDLYRIEIHRTSMEGGGMRRACVILDIHHIISDGLSFQVFRRDLQKVLSGQTIEVERYSAYDFAIDQRELANSPEYDAAEKWFDSLISGKEATVYPHSYEGLEEPALASLVSECNGSAVDEYCRTHGFTQSNYFLTAFLYLLHEMTREEDLLITTINNGRHFSSMMDTIGMFVTTLPVSVSGGASIWDKPVKDAVGMIQRQQFRAQDYDFYPFTRMVERHGIHAEVMYEYQGGITDRDREGISEADNIDVSLDVAKLPLMLSVDHGGKDGAYRFLARYDQSAYSKADMERMLRMLSSIAERMPEAPSMESVDLLDKADMEDVLSLSTGPHMDFGIGRTFVRAFRECASSHSGDSAVEDEGGTYSYEKLDSSSDVLANVLVDAGVKPDDFVALLLDRTWFFPLSIIAVHKAGAAYVPMDLEYPEERLQYMLDDCRAKVLLTTRRDYEDKRRNGLGTSGIDVIFVEELDLSVKAEPVDLSDPSGNAYLVYTSGSTGKPKGTVLHQAGLWNLICSVRSIYGHTAKDRIASHRSFSFVSHVEDIFVILTVGGSLHIMPSGIRKDLDLVHEYLSSHQITGCGFIASVTMLLLKNYELNLRYVTGGGESLSGVVNTGHPQIIHSYGPTESTDHTSVFLLEKGREYERIPVGKPLPNNWMFVLSADGKLLPRGVAGELCFAGIQVAKGYLNNPELTAEKFCDCPFVDKDYWGRPVRMYHTGDLVRWNEDGYLEHIGRIDHQFKLRGFRIEPGEIENVALKYDGVTAAVAAVRREALVLYWCGGSSEDGIRGYLKERLAEYMLPSAYVHLDAMPLNSNGKIDRKRLPEPEIPHAGRAVPMSGKERFVYDKLKDLLGTDAFCVTDDLIRFGMNSILAMKLAFSLPKEWGIKVSDVVGSRTVRGMLSGNHDVIWFHGKYDPAKKNVAVVHGLIGETELSALEDELSGRFNVLKIEHIYDTILSRDNIDSLVSRDGYDEFIRLYIQRISEVLPEGGVLSLLFGISLGGSMAYDIACGWNHLTGQKPAVIMGDSYIRLSYGKDSLPDRTYTSEEWRERIREVHGNAEAKNRLIYRDELFRTIYMNKKTVKKYDGKVIMLRAVHSQKINVEVGNMLKGGIVYDVVRWLYVHLHIRDLVLSDKIPEAGVLEASHRRQSRNNMSAWKRYKPDMEIIDIDSNHNGFFQDRGLMPQYMGLIEKEVQ